MTGRFTFESETPPQPGGSGRSDYIGAVCRVEASIEDLVFSGEKDPSALPTGITVQDEAQGAFRDEYSVGIFSQGEIVHFSLRLHVSGTNAIVGTALPTVPPDPALFATGTRTLLVSLGAAYQGAQLSVGDAPNFGELTLADEALPCPEAGPAVSLVACSVALGMSAVRRRRRGPVSAGPG